MSQNEIDLRRWCIEMALQVHRSNPGVDLTLEAKKILDWVKADNASSS